MQANIIRYDMWGQPDRLTPAAKPNEDGDFCYAQDVDDAIAEAVAARLRWLNADEVTEPGLYVMHRYDEYDVLRADEHDIASEHMRLLKGNPRFFKLPDDGGA